MRLINAADRAGLLIEDDQVVFIGEASGGRLSSDPMVALTHTPTALDDLARHAEPETLSPAKLCAPVPRPSKIIAVGMNYASHASEGDIGVAASEPVFFAKWPSAVTGPYGEVQLGTRDTVDWEAELVVVIGRTTRNVDAESAWQCVAGLTCGQDISDRTEQFRHPFRLSMAKSFDTFAPIGPVLVTPDEFANPDDLEIVCRVDGDEVQRARTSELIYSVPELIARASQIATLEPGDLLFTGTPAGVGYFREPQRFLAPGSVIETEIEGIGLMRNPCVGTS